jgi:hypothetical protein
MPHCHPLEAQKHPKGMATQEAILTFRNMLNRLILTLVLNKTVINMGDFTSWLPLFSP